MNYKGWEGLGIGEIQVRAHEAAVALAAKEATSYEYFNVAYTAVFNHVFKKLLMPATEDTPGWVVRLANYFSADAEIDEVQEKVGSNELEYNDRGDPLNQAEFVELTVRFRRNSGGEVKKVETVKISLSNAPETPD